LYRENFGLWDKYQSPEFDLSHFWKMACLQKINAQRACWFAVIPSCQLIPRLAFRIRKFEWGAKKDYQIYGHGIENRWHLLLKRNNRMNIKIKVKRYIWWLAILSETWK
jgi:hypothetical protein